MELGSARLSILLQFQTVTAVRGTHWEHQNRNRHILHNLFMNCRCRATEPKSTEKRTVCMYKHHTLWHTRTTHPISDWIRAEKACSRRKVFTFNGYCSRWRQRRPLYMQRWSRDHAEVTLQARSTPTVCLWADGVWSPSWRSLLCHRRAPSRNRSMHLFNISFHSQRFTAGCSVTALSIRGFRVHRSRIHAAS